MEQWKYFFPLLVLLGITGTLYCFQTTSLVAPPSNVTTNEVELSSQSSSSDTTKASALQGSEGDQGVLQSSHALSSLVGRHIQEEPLLNMTCGSVFQRYDVESLKSDQGQQLFATRPVGCQRVSDGKDGKLLSLEECGVDKAASILEAARIVADQKPKASDVLNVLSDKCPNDQRVAPAADHLVSCQERKRTRLVLPSPSKAALRSTPGTLVKEHSIPGVVEAYQSLPLAQCDAWTYLRCQTDQLANTTVMSLAQGSQKDAVERMLPLLWGEWGPGDSFFCSKSGILVPPHAALQYTHIQKVTKERWQELPMNRKMFFRFKNVTHFQGTHYHSTPLLEPPSRGNGSAASPPLRATYSFTPYFHYIRGLWPRDAIGSINIFPRSSLTNETLLAALPSGVHSPHVVHLEVAYHMPPMDMRFSYHLFGDGFLPMIHALRHRLASGLKTAIMLHRPVRMTKILGMEFQPAHCFYGVDACLVHSPYNGGFAELLEFIAGGLDNIHFVDVPDKRQFPDAPGHIPAFETLRKQRAKTYSSTVFEVDELIVGGPSHCAAALGREGVLIENAEPIRLGKSNLDCGAMMAVFRDTVMAMVQTPNVREGRKAPAFLPKMSTAKVGYNSALRDTKPTNVKRVGGKPRPPPLQPPVVPSNLPPFNSFVLSGDEEKIINTTSRRVLPNVTLAPSIAHGDGNIHVVMLVRRNARGRNIVNEEVLTGAIRSHLTAKHTASNRSVRFTVAELSSLRQAAQLFSSATLLILTHGAAMMYLPLLRPNTGVIVIDLFHPMVVPFLPPWIHITYIVPKCIGAPAICNKAVFMKAVADLMFNEEHISGMTSRIDALLAAQKNTTILYY